VDIDGIDVGVATDKGAFSFDVPPFKVGFPYTFHVAGWVILDPCVLARGRLYLPDPDAEKVTLKVARPGDKSLLSANSIGCLVEEFGVACLGLADRASHVPMGDRQSG
jgi:hypothetical protein